MSSGEVAMTVEEELAVLELLRLREAEFVKVWRCEGAVCQVLGVPSFPFAPSLPDLPSRRRGRRSLKVQAVSRRQGAPSGASGASPRRVPALRKLVSGEDAYRLEYERHGERETSFQQDCELVRRLFLLEASDFQMVRVSTVSFRSLEDWTELAQLWPA